MLTQILSKMPFKSSAAQLQARVNEQLAWLEAMQSGAHSDVLLESMQYLTRIMHTQNLTAHEALKITLLLDERNRVRAEDLTQQYLSVSRANRTVQDAIFQAVYQYQRSLFLQYTQLIALISKTDHKTFEVNDIALLFCRQLNAAFLMAKWRYFEDQPAPVNTWADVFSSCKMMEQMGLKSVSALLYPADETEISVAHLLKFGLLMDTLVKGSFTQQQIELAAKMLRVVLKDDPLDKFLSNGSIVFHIDLNSDKGMERIRAQDVAADYRYFDMKPLLVNLDELIHSIKSQQGLSSHPVLKVSHMARILDLAEKLRLEWREIASPRQRRKEARIKVLRVLNVVYGMESISKYHHAIGAVNRRNALVNEEHDPRNPPLRITLLQIGVASGITTESWSVVDESKSGFAVKLEKLGSWVQTGQLIGFAVPEDQFRLMLANIRSIKRQSDGSFRVGLELLGTQQKTVEMAKVDAAQSAADIDYVVHFSGEESQKSQLFSGLLVKNRIGSNESSLIFPRPQYSSDSQYLMEIESGEKLYQFKQAAIHADWVRVPFTH